jgi:hypothetical protein
MLYLTQNKIRDILDGIGKPVLKNYFSGRPRQLCFVFELLR